MEILCLLEGFEALQCVCVGVGGGGGGAGNSRSAYISLTVRYIARVNVVQAILVVLLLAIPIKCCLHTTQGFIWGGGGGGTAVGIPPLSKSCTSSPEILQLRFF